MTKLTKLNPLTVALGAAVVASALSVPVAQASQVSSNPFAASDLSHGYQQIADNMSSDHMKSDHMKSDHMDKKGEGSCGASKKKMDKKGEGSCGASKS